MPRQNREIKIQEAFPPWKTAIRSQKQNQKQNQQNQQQSQQQNQNENRR